MKPIRVLLHCEPFAPRAGLSGVVHGPWTIEKITVARPIKGHLDQEFHCPTCDASLVVRTYPWAATATVRRRRMVPIFAVLTLTFGWAAAAVLAVPALRGPLAVAAVPILFLLLGLAARLAQITGADLTDGVEYDGAHPRHSLGLTPGRRGGATPVVRHRPMS